MKYMMILSYDGSKFHGFQRQKDVRNVQGYLEEKLSKYLAEKVVVKGAGRTDRGVHARYQVVHFQTDKDIKGIKYKLNKELKDVRIRKIKQVNELFHARYSVKSKTYLYKLDLTGKRNLEYFGYDRNNINLAKIRKTSKLFVGTHNFKNFVGGVREDYTSTIFSIKIFKVNSVIYFKFKGIGFYRYMVRNLVGALVEIGKNKIDEQIIEEMLLLKTDKRLPTSSPNGLYLTKIAY